MTSNCAALYAAAEAALAEYDHEFRAGGEPHYPQWAADFLRHRIPASQSTEHTCHVPHCGKTVPPERLMCLAHWRMVPASLKRGVWTHYRRGQCDDKQPSAQYVAAAREAIAAVQSKLEDKVNCNESLPLL